MTRLFSTATARLPQILLAATLASASPAHAHPHEGKVIDFTFSYARNSQQEGRSNCTMRQQIRFAGGKAYYSTLHHQCGNSIIPTGDAESGGVYTVNRKATSTVRCRQTSSTAQNICDNGSRSAPMPNAARLNGVHTTTMDFRIGRDGTIQTLDSTSSDVDAMTINGVPVRMQLQSSGRTTISVSGSGCQVVEFSYDTRGSNPASQRLTRSQNCSIR